MRSILPASRLVLALLAAAIIVGLVPLAWGAPRYKLLHIFTGGTDGIGGAGVTLDRAGNLYATSLGGGSQNCRGGCGLVFKLTPHADGKWGETVLYTFQGGDDGENPSGGLVFDAQGNLYGTTSYGGAHRDGTAFELTPAPPGWVLNTLYAFCPKIGKSGCEDGGGTGTGLALSPGGDLYGVKGGGAPTGARRSNWRGAAKDGARRFCIPSSGPPTSTPPPGAPIPTRP